MRRACSAALGRRIDAAEAEVAKRWLDRVVAVVGDELQRQPEPAARDVMQRIADLEPGPSDDPATLILDAVRAASPQIADTIDRRLGRLAPGVDQ
jgi:hypothetical protein